jgi:hypothetical protein
MPRIPPEFAALCHACKLRRDRPTNAQLNRNATTTCVRSREEPLDSIAGSIVTSAAAAPARAHRPGTVKYFVCE